MQNNYLNSVNLNKKSNFPYLCMNVENGKSTPMSPGFHVMHWHEDFQFIYVFSGEVYLHALDKSMLISNSNGVFINKNVVHLVLASPDCHYKSFLFPKQLVSFQMGSPALQYVERISECEQITCVPLNNSISWHNNILRYLNELSNIEDSRAEFYEYEVLVLLSRIWLQLTKNLIVPKQMEKNEIGHRMQQFLSYIEQHYSENITLKNIADSAGVSKSECLRCFRLSMQNTPYEYLIEYRLSKAKELLLNTCLSIGEVTESVGFHSQSHFGKVYKQRTGYSPQKYRKANKK